MKRGSEKLGIRFPADSWLTTVSGDEREISLAFFAFCSTIHDTKSESSAAWKHTHDCRRRCSASERESEPR